MTAVLFDCDDVLLDLIGGFGHWLRNEKGLKTNGDRPDDWNMSNWMGVSYEKSMEFIAEHNNTSENFGLLEPVPGAVKGVHGLYEQGYDLVIVTAYSTEPVCVRRRHENLDRVFGDVFSAVHCVPLGTKKTDYLRMYDPTTWVEDNYKNAILGKQEGHTPIILRQPHNEKFEAEDPDGAHWVSEWSEIESLVYGHAKVAELA